MKLRVNSDAEDLHFVSVRNLKARSVRGCCLTDPVKAARRERRGGEGREVSSIYLLAALCRLYVPDQILSFNHTYLFNSYTLVPNT